MMGRALVLLALLGACPAGPDTASPDTTDTEVDTDACGYDRLDRAAFDAGHLFAYCEYALSCPNSPFTGQSDCQSYVRGSWNSLGCWDTCLAGECAAWVATTPVCNDIDDPIDPACNDMPNCAR